MTRPYALESLSLQVSAYLLEGVAVGQELQQRRRHHRWDAWAQRHGMAAQQLGQQEAGGSSGGLHSKAQRKGHITGQACKACLTKALQFKGPG